MNPALSNALFQAISGQPSDPVRVVDPQSNLAYIVVRAEIFEEMQSMLLGGDQLSDTYPAQEQAAMRAGWDDPGLDGYNQYNENFKKR